jgi:hypothetical protein
MRQQELCFSAFVLGAAIASDNGCHCRNMRPEPAIFQPGSATVGLTARFTNIACESSQFPVLIRRSTMERKGRWEVTLPGRSGRVELSKQWRIKAADCLRLSRQASTFESQSHWVSMAEFWFKVAKHAENREVNDSVDPATIDLTFNSKRQSG